MAHCKEPFPEISLLEIREAGSRLLISVASLPRIPLVEMQDMVGSSFMELSRVTSPRIPLVEIQEEMVGSMLTISQVTLPTIPLKETAEGSMLATLSLVMLPTIPLLEIRGIGTAQGSELIERSPEM